MIGPMQYRLACMKNGARLRIFNFGAPKLTDVAYCTEPFSNTERKNLKFR